ncbi:SET domain-containing protein-lysine N-methyltransferase [Sphingomonas baiyangensis]|uniref:SET domain-containing protein n=1 Tax=Sphingomonas baiyangensis TaxID=2572576 RepID=A0A4U1L137_9SPHN|nr:SET domain-containing protein-lysine N-methyltransferase [Sphingomonas baiyangensis]TKD50511.1 SET domain-containing protein [Sphingomonas baiyangensis]
MPFELWVWVAIAFHFAGYGTYLLGLRRQQVEPNRASWLIWSAATVIEAVTYSAANPGSPTAFVFLASAGACILVLIGIWRRSAWARPTRPETICMIASFAALILWLVFREAFWAHMLVVLVVPISFLPTWASARADPAREASPAWGLWTLGDTAALLTALAARDEGVSELAYIVMEIVCHASVWAIVGLGTINPLARFGPRAPHRSTAGGDFDVGDTHLGKAVFARRAFDEGEPLMMFTGRRIRADRVPSLLRGSADRFVQVTPDHFMGPSGRIDDLVNHSCDPNGGLRFSPHGVTLVALRAIAPGEEISWDYSTALAQSNWHMICRCGASGCRRVIGNFETLSAERQEYFRARNLVAPYLRRRDALAPLPARPHVRYG